jgi:glycosyltransferase involved in cell wall biosynthesis
MKAEAKNTDRPRVSVGLPVFNGENYLAAAIDSVLEQGFEDLELIISDNASTDGTADICAEYARRDRRVRVARNSLNLGAAANYNRVFDLARGRYFKWAAHDDLLAPDFLERCVEVLDQGPPDVVLCFPESVIITADGEVIDRLPENPDLRFEEDLDLRQPTPHERLRHLIHNMSMCHAVFGLVRSDALRRTRLIDRFHSSDVVLLTELALQGRFWTVREPLFLRRLHPGISMWNKTPEEVAAWFDPEAPPRVVLRHNRLFAEQVRSIMGAELATIERGRCLLVMVTDELRRKRRIIVTEWFNALRRTVAPPRPAAAEAADRAGRGDREPEPRPAEAAAEPEPSAGPSWDVPAAAAAASER